MPAQAVQHVQDALWLSLWLSLPVLGAVAVAGAVAGGFASLTRLGDATGSAVPRQLAAGLVLSLAGTWMAQQLFHFTAQLWTHLGALAGP